MLVSAAEYWKALLKYMGALAGSRLTHFVPMLPFILMLPSILQQMLRNTGQH